MNKLPSSEAFLLNPGLHENPSPVSEPRHSLSSCGNDDCACH
jgi:hypothetical protein